MASPYRAPVIGPWAAKIGRVIDIVSMPCTPTDTMWTRGFFTAIPWLIISLFKPDPLDLTFERLGSPHRSRRKARFSIERAIQGQLLPGPSGLERTALFALGEWAQRVGWWFCVIDSGIDFAVNWVSATYQYAGCIPGSQGPCKLNDPTQPYVPGEIGTMLWNTLDDPDGWSTVDGIRVPPGVHATVTLSVVAGVWEPAGPPPGSLSAQLINVTTGQTIGRTPVLRPGPTGTPGSYALIRRDLFGAAVAQVYKVRYRNEGGFTDASASTFSAMGAGNSNFLPDP